MINGQDLIFMKSKLFNKSSFLPSLSKRSEKTYSNIIFFKVFLSLFSFSSVDYLTFSTLIKIKRNENSFQIRKEAF